MDICTTVYMNVNNYPVRPAQERVKRLCPYVYLCVVKKHSLTARKLQRNGPLPLAFEIYSLRKMPRKLDESSVECCGHGFLIAGRPYGGITVTRCVGPRRA